MTSVRLRPGTGPVLFTLPGAGGAAEELAPLAEALDGGVAVFCLEPFAPPDDGTPFASVEEIARRALDMVKAEQPEGPYYLLGYSFGGVVALEAADALRAQGDRVAFVGVVDPVYDQRYWPTRIFVRATVRRSARHLRGMLGQPPAGAWSELRRRTGRLLGGLGARAGRQADADLNPADVESANLAALARWRPRRLDGRAVLFTSGNGEDFACDPARLWEGLIEDLEVVRVPGSHLGIVRDADSIRALAQAVDAKLASARVPRLRVLLATTFGWESACRLAIELAAVGCLVEAIAPPSSFLHRLSSVARSYRLGRLWPETSLRRALLESDADLVVPFDDRTRHALHRVYDAAAGRTRPGPRLRERIARSLGSANAYPHVFSRASIMGMAADGGFNCPPTEAISSLDQLLQWMAQHGPVVLKTDGSWGGRETAVATDPGEAARAWRRLSRPPSWGRVAKRFVIDRDPWPLRARLAGQRPAVSAQVYVEGEPANLAAACVRGELLGAVQARVVRSNGKLGPSTVIRLIDHPEMVETARGIIGQLELTGLCGLDFVIEPETGRAHLVELNPRATPTAHLVTADGVDLLVSLRDALGHAGPPARTYAHPEELIALFPQELRRDPSSPFLQSAYHDVPTDPELVAHVMARGRRPFRLRGRVAIRLWPT
jgi:thioesterase domain-containing protein